MRLRSTTPLLSLLNSSCSVVYIVENQAKRLDTWNGCSCSGCSSHDPDRARSRKKLREFKGMSTDSVLQFVLTMEGRRYYPGIEDRIRV